MDENNSKSQEKVNGNNDDFKEGKSEDLENESCENENVKSENNETEPKLKKKIKK